MLKPVAELLRRGRTAVAETLGAAVAAIPALERPFIAAGKGAARWHYPGSVYWESHQALARRLRISGRRFRTLNILGQPIILDVTDSSAYMRYFHAQPYEPELTAFIAEARASRAPSSWTSGANIGLFTLLAARCASPGGRVLAFEPHPDARARMQHLLALNGLTDLVTVSEAALSDRSAPSAPLFLASDSVLSTLDPAVAPLAAEDAFSTSVDVPVSTLDDWLAAAGPVWKRHVDRRDEDRRRGNGGASPPRDDADAGAQSVAEDRVRDHRRQRPRTACSRPRDSRCVRSNHGAAASETISTGKRRDRDAASSSDCSTRRPRRAPRRWEDGRRSRGRSCGPGARRPDLRPAGRSIGAPAPGSSSGCAPRAARCAG